MKWTDARPTVEGWYWMRCPNDCLHVARVATIPGNADLLVWEIASRDAVELHTGYYDGCRWAGPIQEPEEER